MSRPYSNQSDSFSAMVYPRIVFFLVALLIPFPSAQFPSVQGQTPPSEERRVVFLGDSITYDGRWVVRIESALRQAPEFQNAEILNLGLGSETVSGLSEPGHAGGKFPRPSLHERLERVLEQFRPNLVIACYGINDGIYQSLDEERVKAFQQGILRLKEAVETKGGTIIFLSPHLFQADTPEKDTVGYSRVLDAQAEWLRERAEKDGWKVVDFRAALMERIKKQKKIDPEFIFASDGIHPGETGHHLLAEIILPELCAVLNIPDSLAVADEEAIKILSARANLLKHSWLSQIGHRRPGVPQGISVDEANREGKQKLAEFIERITTKTDNWKGYQRAEFKFEGRNAILVSPKKAAESNPWIWRTEFFGHEPQLDLALLESGYHVAYIDMQNMYGSPAAMKVMDEFHNFLVSRHRLKVRVVLEGFSRGGLFALNWGALRPQFCSAIYVDAPVCDIRSWPGGKGKGPGSPSDWNRLLKIYGLSNEQAMAFSENPIDKAEILAKEKIPVIAVIGQDDEVVPVPENIDVLETRILKAGGLIEVIRKEGVKHHPHSLKDPRPIKDFLLKQAR